MPPNTAVLIYAVIAVAGLVILTTRFKLSAFISLIVASLFLGLCSGLPPARVLKAFEAGVAAVLGSIAMIIALGTIIGKILAESGGAAVLSRRITAFFGPDHLSFAFFVIGLVIGLPVFFAVGIVLLVPLLNSATRSARAPLRPALAMIAGLSAAHGLVPPHPGPLTAIELLHADLGKTLLYSLPVAAVAGFVAGPLLARLYPERLMQRDAPAAAEASASSPPGFGRTLATILLPIILIAAAAVPPGVFPGPLGAAIQLAGSPVPALLIGVLFAYLGTGRGFSRAQLLRFSEDSLAPVAVMLLVIGAGAGFSRVLIESGAGKAVADLATQWQLRAVPMGFVLAALIRVATGSATVAITTSAGLLKSVVEAQPGTHVELVVLSMGAGSLILSHVNDGGFWLVKEYLNLSVPQALKTWTVLETVLSLAAFGCILLLDWI